MANGNTVLESLLLIFITGSIAIVLYVFFTTVQKAPQDVSVVRVDTLIRTVEIYNDSAINLTYTVDSLSEVISNQLGQIENLKRGMAKNLEKLKREYEITKDSIKNIASDSELVGELRSRVR